MGDLKLVNINDERFWDILFDEACVEGQQATRIRNELEKIIAYDVEKVVADVKEENKRALKEMYNIHGNQYTTILLKKHNDKIDFIVRNGGKE